MSESNAMVLDSPSLPILPDRIHVTKLALDPVNREQLFDWVINSALLGKMDRVQRTVSYLNVHVANVAASDEKLTQYINKCCDLVYCDGNGIGWGARIHGYPKPPRMTAADWLPELLKKFAEADLRLFIVAGKPGVVEKAIANMSQTVGSLGEMEIHDGYLDTAKSDHAIERINRFQPDVVLVGMGSPMQEHWVNENRNEIQSPVVWTIGATFDYFAEEQQRGPQWLRDSGHEWAARLVADPVRLWKRYLLGNPRFLLRALLTGRNKQNSELKTD